MQNLIFVVVSFFLLYLSVFPVRSASETTDLRLCAAERSEIVPGMKFSALEKYGAYIPEFIEFIESVDHSPKLHEIVTFLEGFSSLSLDRAEDSKENTARVMSIAYRFRLAISVIQLDYCVHPSFLISYEKFLAELREIDFPLDFEAKTLEGFLFLHEFGVNSIDQEDVSFISDHLIDTPINGIVRDRILALSHDPSVNEDRLKRFCEAISVLGFKSEIASDLGQISLDEIGCFEIDKSIVYPRIEVDKMPSNFAVILTEGRDISISSGAKQLPAFDLSSKLDQEIFPALQSSPENSVTVPLVAIISPRNSDGSPRLYRGRFDGIVTIIHLFLVRPADGVRDERIATPAKPGGSLTISSYNHDLLESAIAYTSGGQFGASFLPSEGTPETVTKVDRQTINNFFFNNTVLEKTGSTYVPILIPKDGDFEGLLFVETPTGRSSMDVHVHVLLEWLQFLEEEQKVKLEEACGNEIAKCIASKLEEQLAQTSRQISRSCGGSCDMRALGFGLESFQPAGSDAPSRLDAPSGETGSLTLLNK